MKIIVTVFILAFSALLFARDAGIPKPDVAVKQQKVGDWWICPTNSSWGCSSMWQSSASGGWFCRGQNAVWNGHSWVQ
jgi:hypothetical protein